MKNYTLHVNDASGSVQSVKLHHDGSLHAADRVRVPKNSKIQLIDDETQLAPDNIRIERVGNDLHVAFPGTDIASPDLILEDFYTSDGGFASLVGQAENGMIYEYVPENGVTADYIGNIASSVVSGQVLGGSSVPAFFVAAPVADVGAGGWALAALAVGAVAAGAALAFGDNDNHSGPAPAPPTPVGPSASGKLADASDSGIKGDNRTNVNTPTITGTGTAGDKITVTLPTGEVLQTTIAADGTWSITPTHALPDGSNTITIVETNPAGVSGPPATLVLAIDTVPPVAPGASLTHDATNDTGASATDSITSNTKPSLSGTGEPGTTISVTVGGTGGGTYTTTVAANGTWTVPTTGTLADGTHTLTVTSTDAAGNSTTATGTSVVVDTTAPAAPTGGVTHDAADDTGASATDSLTSNNHPGLSGTGEPGSTVTVVVGGVGGGTYTATVGGNGSWTIPTTGTLADGTHPVTVTSTDAAGNATTAVGTPIVVDTTAPTAPTASLTHDAADDTGASSTDSITGNATPSLSGTGEAGTTINVAVDGGTPYTTTVAANGTWTVPTTGTLSNGTHTLTVTSTDAAGNVTTGTTTPFTVDTIAPSAPTGGLTHDAADDTGPSATDSITNNPMPSLTGTGEPGSTISVTVGGTGGGTYITTVGPNGTWTIPTTMALGDGTHPVTITSTDAAGNSTTAAGTPIVVNTTAPGAPTANLTHDTTNDTGASSTDSITSDKTPSLSGTGVAGTTINVSVDGGTPYTTTVGTGGTWTVQTTGTLSDTTHTLTVTSTDSAGNVTTGTGIPFVVDTMAPVAPTGSVTHDAADDTGVSATDSITSNKTPSLSGTGEPGSTITVVVGGVGGGTYTTTVGNNGSWTVGTTAALTDGTHPVTVTSTDAAGNSTTAAGTPIVVDTMAPGVPTANVTHDTTDDTGVSSTDSITSDKTPSLSGTGDVGSTIAVTVGGAGGGTYTTTVGAGGTWTVATTGTLADGTHALTVTSTDAAGNTTTGTTTPIVVDTTAPAAPTANVTHDAADDTGASTTDSITSNATPSLSGTGEIGSTIVVTVGGTGGGTYTTTVGTGGIWTVATTGALADGTHALTVTSTDSAGNSTTAAGTPIVVNTTAPGAPTANLTHDTTNDTGASSTDSITSDKTPSLSGTGVAGTTINVSVDGGTPYTTTVGTGGTWTVQTTGTLSDTTHTLTVTSTDSAGNVTTGTGIPFVVDTMAPVAPTGSVTHDAADDTGVSATDSITSNKTPSLSGTGEPGSTITVVVGGVGGGTYTTTVGNNGSWTVGTTAALTDGTHPVTVTSTDAAGNSTTAAGTPIVVDTMAPGVPTANVTHDTTDDTGVSSTDSITSDKTPSLSGTGDVGSTIAVTVGGAGGGTYTTTVGAGGTWTVATTGTLADGTHALTVTSTDAAGNTTTGTTTPIVVDTTAPAAPTANVTHDAADDTGASTTDSITSNATPSLSGTGEIGSTIVVTVGGTGGGTYTTTVGTGGIWTVATTGALADGTHALTVTSTDSAGNSTTAAGTPIVVNTTAPGAPTANLTHDTTNDTGASSTDSITSDKTPSLSGTGVAGTTINVSVDGGTPYTTTVGTGGTWTVQTTGTLSDTTHTLTVTSTDSAGNVTTGTGIPFVVDTMAPVAPTGSVTHDAADDTGVSATDSITSNKTPSLSGTGEPGSTITVVVGGTGGGTYTTTVNGNGSWTVGTTAALTDGTHPVTVTSTDAAGNSITAAGTPIVVDTMAPVAPTANVTHDATNDTGTSTLDSITSDKTPSLSGTGEAGTVIKVTVDGTTTYTTTAVSGNTWTVPTTGTLSDGTHTLTVTSTDTAGNTTTGTTTPFVVDSTAPVAPTANVTHDATNDTGTSTLDSITSDKTPSLSGTGEAGTVIKVTVDGTTTYTTTAVSGNTWTVPTTGTLSDGTHTLTVTSTDTAGNTTTGTTTPFVVDSTAPVAPTANVTHDATNDTGTSTLDSITSDKTPSLSGTGEAGTVIKVTVDGTTTYTTTAVSGNTWTVPTTGTLSDGTHTLTVTSTDTAGNTTTGTTTPFVVDSTAPVAPTANVTHDATNDTGTSTLDSITSDKTPSLSGTGEAGTVIKVTVDGTTTYTTTAVSGNTWTVPTTGTLSDGTHTLTVTSTDTAGNTTTGTTTPFVVDSTAPVAPTANVTHDATNDTGTSTLDSITSDKTPSLSGTGEAGTVIKVTVDGTTTYTTTAVSGNTWTVPTTGTLSDGTHTLTVTSTDTAGNTTTGTTTPFVVDSTAPVAPTANVTHDATNDTGTSTLDSITSDKTPSLSGTGEAGTVIKVTVDGTTTYTTTAVSGNTWTVPTTGTLSDGTHTLTVTSTDTAGNTTTGTTTPFVVDSTAPVAPTANVTHDATNDTGTSTLDSITSDKTPSLSGTGEAGTVIKVTVDGTTTYTTTAVSGNTWTVPTTGTLSDGTHTLTVTSTDTAGNTTTGTTTPFVVDATAPTIAPQSASYAEGTASGTTLATVAASDGGSGIKTYGFAVTGGGTSTTSSDGFYSINANTGVITLTAAGANTSTGADNYQTAQHSYVESVTVTDVAGNTSSANVTLNLTDVAPTASPVKETGVANAPLTLTLAAFGGSDTAGTTLSYKITSLPTNGTLTDNGTAVTVNQVISSADISSGKLIFTPATGESGYPGYNSAGVGNGKNDYAAIGYQVSDGALNSATSTLLLDIAPPPTINGATALQIFTNFDRPITGQYAPRLEYGTPPSPWLTSNQGFAANNNTPGTVEVGLSSLYGITGPVSNVMQPAELNTTANNFYTTFNTVAGQTYVLTFDYAYEADNTQGGDVANMSKITVRYGASTDALGTSNVVGTYTGTGTTPAFQHETITLTGTGSMMRVEFDAPTGDQNGGLLDNIALNSTTNTGGVGATIQLQKLTPALAVNDGSETMAVTFSGIPVGDTISDGTNSFTATTGNTTATVTNWNLSTLTYVGVTAETVNLTATITATETSSGASDSASSTYQIIVAPAITGPNGTTGTAAVAIVGTGVNDTISADQGTDTLTGAGGNNNHFVFGAGTGANKPTDTITDFSLASGPGDVIDLKGLLSGATGTVTAANIGNYLQLSNSGTTEILKVNLAGAGNFSAPDLTINLTAATTHGVPATETLQQLIASHNLIIM